MKLPHVPVTKINTTSGTQMRVAIVKAVVDEYAELIEAGEQFPPLTVFKSGATYYLADGFHRLAAYVQTGHKTVECEVHTGNLRDAQAHALGANATHGLPRNNADKRRAVEIVLGDTQWAKLSIAEQAKLACVSERLVAKMREERQRTGGTATPESDEKKDKKKGGTKPAESSTDPTTPPPTTSAPTATSQPTPQNPPEAQRSTGDPIQRWVNEFEALEMKIVALNKLVQALTPELKFALAELVAPTEEPNQAPEELDTFVLTNKPKEKPVMGPTIEQVGQAWDKKMDKKIPTKITNGRSEKIRVRLKEKGWYEAYLACLTKLPLKHGPNGWTPDLDWLIWNDTNVYKVLDGKYDRKLAVGSLEWLNEKRDEEASLRPQIYPTRKK